MTEKSDCHRIACYEGRHTGTNQPLSVDMPLPDDMNAPKSIKRLGATLTLARVLPVDPEPPAIDWLAECGTICRPRGA